MAEEEVGSLSVSVGLSAAEFNRGIKEVSQRMQIAGQEFANASAGLDRVADAAEISRLNMTRLTSQIGAQQTIVDQLRTAHRNAAEQYGETSRQAQAYQVRLLRAEGALQGMERQLVQTTNELENMGEEAEESGINFAEFGEKLKSMGAMAATGILAIGTAFVGMVGVGVMSADELQGALDNVQASTGAADEGMEDMQETMLGIYNNNFGESLADIGAAMGSIAQQTGLTGEALQTATESALALRDTFGFEVTESIRTVDMMMKQFGISSDEAFNLIAQGAQAGLDKNGNLLDSINEYSIHFEQLGFDGEEMFNMMANGAKAGVFDVDKLGDAMKEFGIRSKDASKTSAAGFEALGLDATEMTTAFNEGGEAGKEAFGKVTKALFEMDDLTAQNMTGVALFGTQWEDIGVKGVKSLVDTQGEISNTVDALGKINEVKYNTFGEATEGIKRNLQTGILVPLGEKVLPKLNEFAAWITENTPQIKNDIEFVFNSTEEVITDVGVALEETREFFEKHWGVVEPILAGIAAGAVTIGAVTTATKLWTLATQAGTLAQAALNVVMNLSPLAKVALLVGALVTAGVALYRNWDTVKEKAGELWDAVGDAFVNGVNGAIDMINSLIEKINMIPGVNAPLISRVIVERTTKEKSDSFNAVRGIEGNADGTDYWPGGLTWVGEEGPELINLQRGAQVFTNSESMAMANRLKSLSPTASNEQTASSRSLSITINNMGTIVGSNGMNEFADTISRRIAHSTGLTMGGAW